MTGTAQDTGFAAEDAIPPVRQQRCAWCGGTISYTDRAQGRRFCCTSHALAFFAAERDVEPNEAAQVKVS